MKLKSKILLLTMLTAAALPPARAAAEDCSAAAMILYEPSGGTVLAEKDADARLPIASTTKIMTALIVLENCALDEPVTVTAAHAAVEGSSMYLHPGGEYTVEDLLYGLMLASGNDAALALAEHTAGSAEVFAELMNDKCAALGLENTHFENPHGLDGKSHYSSARDLAVITAAAMENDDFCRFFSTERKCVRGVTYVNHNKLLQRCEGCIGGKTGYTSTAGRSLVSCTEREGMRLICVTLSDPCDWDDHIRLYDDAFASYRFLSLPEPHWTQMTVLSGTEEQAELSCGAAGLVVPKDAEVAATVCLPHFLFAPLTAGDAVGSVTVTVDGETVFSEPIRCVQDIPLDAHALLSPWERFSRHWKTLCAARFERAPIWSA